MSHATWCRKTRSHQPPMERTGVSRRSLFSPLPLPTRGLLLWLSTVTLLVAGCSSSPPSLQIVKETVVVTRVITRIVTQEPVTPTPNTVTLCLGTEPNTLDPLQDTTDTGYHLRGLWGDMILVPGPEGNWTTEVLQQVPSVANGDVQRIGPEGPDAQLRITFRFRPGWRWEDGTPFTARDILTAWEWARKGWGTPEQQALAQDVVSMEAKDDTTLLVVLRRGLITPLYAKYLFGPYPTQWVKEHPPDRASERPYWPSFGPYRLDAWQRGQGATWVVNPNYARLNEGLPRIQTVHVRFLSDAEEALVALFSGRCHLLSPQLLPISAYPLLEEARRQEVIAYRAVLGPAWEHLDFNTWPPKGRTPFFADARARLAVTLALDRARIASAATHDLAEPMASWLPKGHWAYQPLPPLEEDAFAPQRSRALLAEMGWRDEDEDGVLEAHGVSGTFWDGTPWEIPDNTPFVVELVTSMDDPIHARVAQLVQSALQEIGIRVEMRSVPGEALFAADSPIRRRAFDLALFAWLPDTDVDGRYLWVGNEICRRPDGTLYAAKAGQSCDAGDERLFAPQIPTADNEWEGGNVSGWADPEASLAIYQATAYLRPEDRAAYYLVHQMRFAEHMPVIPLFQRPQLWAWRSGLKGPTPGPFTPITWNAETWQWTAPK